MEELKIDEVLNEYTEKAKTLIADDGQLEQVLSGAENAIKEIPSIGGKLSYVPLMFSMVRSYAAKEYEVNAKAVASMVGAFLYLISKKDLISDKIPVIGLMDDLAVFALAIGINKDELDKYSAWREAKKEKAAAPAEETPAE